MAWTLGTDGFYDYTPSTATEIFYIAETGNNATASVNNKNLPWRTTNTTRIFTVSGANAKRGARYQAANGVAYYVVDTISGGNSLLCIDNGGGAAPTTPLSLLDGGGGISDAIIAFSAVASPVNGAIRSFEVLHGGAATINIAQPAWFLFRMGDRFEHQSLETQVNDNFTHMGAGYQDPMIFGSYDPSITQTTSWNSGAQFCTVNPKTSALDRPYISSNLYAGGPSSLMRIVPGGGGVAADFGLNNGGNNIVVVGLEIDGFSQGDHAFFNSGQPISFFRFEDLKIYDWGQIAAADGSYYRDVCYGAGQGIEGNGHPLALYDINSLGTLFEIKESLLDDNGTDGFNHQVYGGSDANPWFGMDPGPIVFQGSLFTRTVGDHLTRGGGTFDNSCFIANAGDLDAMGNPGNRTTTITNNVGLHSAGGPFIAGMSRMQYVSNRMNQGPVTITNNICAHETANMSKALQIPEAARSFTYTSNLFYKVCASAGSSAVINLPTAGGVICHSGTITNAGSGYTDKTVTVNGLSTITSGSGAQRRVVPLVTLTGHVGWPWLLGTGIGEPAHIREGWVVLGDFTSPFDVLNGRLCRVYYAVSGTANTVQLNGNFTEIDGLTYSGNGGKLYIPYLGRQFSNPHGGTVFRADVHIKGGVVVAITEGTDADDSVVQMPTGQPGNLYQVNDSLTLAGATGTTDGAGIDIGVIPGGSGFTFRVDEIETHTDGGGNVIDTDGTGAIGNHPGLTDRTAATYYNEVILGAGLGSGAGGYTDADFITAAKLQRRQNWNRLLMAESLNDYIRQGFGKTMLGSAYADTQNGGTPPTQVLMPQICM